MFPISKIILVEDNKHDAFFIHSILKQTDFKGEVMWLKDGQEFINYLEDNDASEILFVLLDIKMPRMGGIATLEKLSKLGIRKYPIILCSASKHIEDIYHGLNFHANAFIIKESDFNHFTQSIKDTYNFWGKRNILKCSEECLKLHKHT